MASALIIPDLLKQIKPYMTLSSQLEQRNEHIVAYYCRLYALQHAMNINKSDRDCKKFLLQLMDMLEATKAQYKNEEAIASQMVGQAMVEKQALNIFNKADMEDREGKFTKNLVKQFYSSGLLFDSLNYFGDLSEDLVAKKQYAKRKAMYLNRCFQTGETPVAGPLIGDETGQDESVDQNQDIPGASHLPPPPPSNYQHYESPPDPMPRSNPVPQPSPQQTIASGSNEFSPEMLLKAQKLCKFASSALEYEDIPTAITNLEQCLSILKYSK